MVKEQYSGYTIHGEPVDVRVTADNKAIPVTVQSDTVGWSVEQLQVYIYIYIYSYTIHLTV